MDKKLFLKNILPGNYFITKSMELTKSQSSGTLWYTKKFIVLYYYIFLSNNITTSSIVKEIIKIFDDYIKSLPLKLQKEAEDFFYASKDVADLRNKKFKLFDTFAGQIRFANDNERYAYYECAKKYYFAFLMESGGQSGVKAHIKNKLYEENFVFSDLENIISQYIKNNGYNNLHYKSKEDYITGIRNDYMAFVRNERQILFYYGFFHSKSNGSNDQEFSSLTPIGELALHSNYYELIVIWEHQKIKMVSQPVTIEIQGLKDCIIDNAEHFDINLNPYLTILKSLNATNGFTKETYQYLISRLPEYPTDGIDISTSFMELIKAKVNSFKRQGDKATEDFNKEILKYILGIRSDLHKDDRCNPLGLCEWNRNGLTVTNKNKLKKRFIRHIA